MLGFLQEFEGYDPMTAGILRLAEYVHQARTSKGLSIEKVRERGGPSVGWLSSLENGTMVDTPKPITLRRLADALGEPVEVLQGMLRPPADSMSALSVGPSIHLPELEHLSAAERERVQAAAREAAQEEIRKIRATPQVAIAELLAIVPEDMKYPPTVAELRELAKMPRALWEGTDLDPRSGSSFWEEPSDPGRLNELKLQAEALGVGKTNNGRARGRKAQS